MWEYTDKVKEHFLNPHNVGEIENPDGVAEVGSLACGDALKLTFKLDENKRIKDAKFKTFGEEGEDVENRGHVAVEHDGVVFVPHRRKVVPFRYHGRVHAYVDLPVYLLGDAQELYHVAHVPGVGDVRLADVGYPLDAEKPLIDRS